MKKKIIKKYQKKQILKRLNHLLIVLKFKILVIGETIIDQYNFCETLGKSEKHVSS